MAQLWVPPIVSSDPLFELQKLASDLQQGRITIEAAYNKMGDISQNLPTSGVAKELWDKFSIIIADAYTTSTKTAKEVGYEITSILTSPEFSQQLNKADSSPKENPFTITKKQKKGELSFDYLQNHATYENMKSYVSNKGGVDSLTQREIEFLQPYLISEHAVQDYEQYTKNSSYLGETYGSYSKGKNDCYTYAVIDEPNHALGISYNPSSNVARKEMNDKEIVRLSEETGSRFYPLSSISSLHLQVGDMIGANVSPNNTGNNHWGIVAIGDSGKPVVIARGSSLEIWGLADFFGLASGVDVIRYGQSSYSQHIVFNPSNSEVQVVSGKEPKNFYE